MAEPTCPLTRRQALLAGVLFPIASCRASADDNSFVVTIARKHIGNECTSGYVAVNGSVVAYALERSWRGNAPLISSIPEGQYAGLLRYDHPDKWRIELKNVPGREAIQIHAGNTINDTEGCILVGLSLGADLCSVVDSRKAYAALKKAFYGTETPISTPNKIIKVQIKS